MSSAKKRKTSKSEIGIINANRNATLIKTELSKDYSIGLCMLMFIMPKINSNTTDSQNFQLSNSGVLCFNRHFVVSRCYKKGSIHLLDPTQHFESALKQNSTLGDDFLSWENMSHVPSIRHFKWSRLCYAAYSSTLIFFCLWGQWEQWAHPAPYKTTTTKLPFSESLCHFGRRPSHLPTLISQQAICLICTGKRDTVSTGEIEKSKRDMGEEERYRTELRSHIELHITQNSRKSRKCKFVLNNKVIASIMKRISLTL